MPISEVIKAFLFPQKSMQIQIMKDNALDTCALYFKTYFKSHIGHASFRYIFDLMQLLAVGEFFLCD